MGPVPANFAASVAAISMAPFMAPFATAVAAVFPTRFAAPVTTALTEKPPPPGRRHLIRCRVLAITIICLSRP